MSKEKESKREISYSGVIFIYSPYSLSRSDFLFLLMIYQKSTFDFTFIIDNVTEKCK